MNHSTKKMTIKYLQQRDIRIICIYIYDKKQYKWMKNDEEDY